MIMSNPGSGLLDKLTSNETLKEVLNDDLLERIKEDVSDITIPKLLETCGWDYPEQNLRSK